MIPKKANRPNDTLQFCKVAGAHYRDAISA